VIDARVEAVFGASAVFRALDRAMTTCLAAWQSSWIRRHVLRVPSAAGRSESLNAIVFWATVGLMAAVTVLVLSPLATTPRPLAWIVPVVAGIASAAIAVFAGTHRSPDGPPR